METTFPMVAKTMKGLEPVLADELRKMGAANVQPGLRMVSFEGNLETLYRANLCLRTALRVLKPIYECRAADPEELYNSLRRFDWSTIMTPDNSFSIDMVVNSTGFSHSRFATYRAKDAIVDWFRDRYDRRPGVRLADADVQINIHINDSDVTVSLDSSGESLHKRGWRVATTEAPINEVLAAGILLLSGYDGSKPLLDPMCGSGTFLVEAALIAANINPGVFRREYAFQHWPDYDAELFESLWNNDAAERVPQCPIYGADMLPQAVEVTQRNLRAAGVNKYVEVQERKLSQWTEAPAPDGIIVMNPPYGERLSPPDMEDLYSLIGVQLKHIFAGWEAWIISLKDQYFRFVGFAPSQKISLLNGKLDCQLRQYIVFSGSKKDFLKAGGKIHTVDDKNNDTSLAAKKNGKGPKRGSKDKLGSEGRGDKRPRENRPAKEWSRERRVPDARPRATTEDAQAPENPLALRRNPEALRSLTNRQPKLAPEVKMRSRTKSKK